MDAALSVLDLDEAEQVETEAFTRKLLQRGATFLRDVAKSREVVAQRGAPRQVTFKRPKQVRPGPRIAVAAPLAEVVRRCGVDAKSGGYLRNAASAVGPTDAQRGMSPR